MGTTPRVRRAARSALNLSDKGFVGTLALANSETSFTAMRVRVNRKDALRIETLCINGLHLQRQMLEGSCESPVVSYEGPCSCGHTETTDLRVERVRLATRGIVSTNERTDALFAKTEQVWSFRTSKYVFVPTPVLGECVKVEEVDGVRRRFFLECRQDANVVCITEHADGTTSISTQPWGEAWLPREVKLAHEVYVPIFKAVLRREWHVQRAAKLANSRNGAERENRRHDRNRQQDRET